MWSYNDALEWLYGRQAIGIKLGLDKVERLLEAIGTPQAQFHSIHIAGTNGKGTVTHFLADMLQRAGHRVGRFTSPHLISFCERVAVDGVDISPDDVARGLDAIRPAVEVLDKDDAHPTFFEIATALAFWHFAQQGVQWAVVETGMGGRLDATNVLQPEVTIITNVAADHQQYLGDSLADITFEKAGIMKRHVPCITAASGAPLAALKATSHALEAPMSVIGEDYHVLPDINGLRLMHPNGEAHYDLLAAGDHQLTNAAIAVAATDALRQQGLDIPPTAVQQTLANTQVPGRMETFLLAPEGEGDGHVEVLIDGAHNVAAAGALRYHLGRQEWAGFALILGFSQDKAWAEMLDQWMPLAARVYATPLRSSRSLAAVEIAAQATAAGFPATLCADVAAAIDQARADGHRRILIAGSLFLVGEARAILTGRSLEEIGGAQ